MEGLSVPLVKIGQAPMMLRFIMVLTLNPLDLHKLPLSLSSRFSHRMARHSRAPESMPVYPPETITRSLAVIPPSLAEGE